MFQKRLISMPLTIFGKSLIYIIDIALKHKAAIWRSARHLRYKKRWCMHQHQHNSLKGTIFCILSVTSLLLLSKCPAQILYRFVNNDEAYLWPLLCLSATISCLGLWGYLGMFSSASIFTLITLCFQTKPSVKVLHPNFSIETTCLNNCLAKILLSTSMRFQYWEDACQHYIRIL